MNDKTAPAIDPLTLPARTGSSYPAPFAKDVRGREKRAMGDAFGLSQFGVNLVRLPPGAMSSQRHWHGREDEFVYVLEGRLTLVTDEGETEMTPGMVAGFKAGVENGHHLINRSGADAAYLEIGSRDAQEHCDYPDIDMRVAKVAGAFRYVRRDGTPY